jgi:hypothetical protein
MYTELNIPIDWIGSSGFFEKWNRTLQDTCKLFGVQIDKERIQNAYDSITADGTIDFGLLDEDYQRDVILKLLSDKAYLQDLLRLNPFLSEIGKACNEIDIIKKNRSAVVRNYNMSLYRQKLLAAYEAVNAYSVHQRIDKEILLMQFLDLTKFSLLKWGDYGIR